MPQHGQARRAHACRAGTGHSGMGYMMARDSPVSMRFVLDTVRRHEDLIRELLSPSHPPARPRHASVSASAYSWRSTRCAPRRPETASMLWCGRFVAGARALRAGRFQGLEPLGEGRKELRRLAIRGPRFDLRPQAAHLLPARLLEDRPQSGA